MPFTAVCSAAFLSLGGCGGSPADAAQTRARNAASDRGLYDAGKPRELYGLTLEQAQELALKYNLDLWMARQQEAIARETKHSSFLKMLPSLTFDYNLEGRDSYNASSSLGMHTGTSAQLTTYSYSADKSHSYGGMRLLWNVLDFGITYFRAKQDMNREKQADYDKQRVRQKLAADVAAAASSSPEEDDFALANAVVSGDRRAALAALYFHKLRREEPIVLLASVSRVVCDLLMVARLREAGLHESEIAAETKLHSYKVSLYCQAVASISADRLLSCAERCRKADRQMKTGSTGYAVLERLICTLPQRKR